MKKIAIALTALGLLAAPALADTIHHDGPGSSFASHTASVSGNRFDSFQSRTTTSDFGASVGDRATHRGVNGGGVLVTVGERLNR
jgi:hypothetical protein